MRKVIFGLVVLGSGAFAQIIGWSDVKKIDTGKNIFNKNCAACHGKKAEGRASFPALNGKGHVGHHSPKKLLTQITNGGGGMPAFKSKLSKQEREFVLIYLHSIWPNRVKHHYDKKFKIKD